MGKLFKKAAAKKLQIEGDTDDISTSDQEGNGRADTSPTARTSSSSATLWIKTMAS